MGVLSAADAAVTEVWVQRYDGPAHGIDEAVAIAIDGSTNVYVAGNSSGNGSGNDFATIAYSSDGIPLWTNRYSGAGNGNDSVLAIAVDISNNVYVTGNTFAGSVNKSDYATIAYSSEGLPLWTNRYNGTGSGDDSASAITTDGSNNVYVTGGALGSGTGYDYVTIGYSSAGVPLWTNLYNGAGNGYDFANAVATDRSGNVYVTGLSWRGAGNEYDYATVAYSGTGVPLWTNYYNGPSHYYDSATALLVTKSNDVIVTGVSFFGESGTDITTLGYDNAGLPLWDQLHDGVEYTAQEPKSMTRDNDNGLYITGNQRATNGYPDYLTVAYSSTGMLLWTNLYNGPGDSWDESRAVAADAVSVYVTGYSQSGASSTTRDYLTIAYTSDGVPLWTNRYNGPTDSADEAAAIVADQNGNVFVTGKSGGDYATIKYSTFSPPASQISIDIQMLGDLAVLSWTNVAFNLQTSPTVGGIYTNILGASSPYTNHTSGPQQYFRLNLD